MVAHYSWGSGADFVATIPLFTGCRQWSSAAPSEVSVNKVKCWLYYQYDTGYSVSFDGAIDESKIEGSWTSAGTSHWSATTWSVADETTTRPTGETWPGVSSSVPISNVKISWIGG